MKRIILMAVLIAVQASYAQRKGVQFSGQNWSEVLLQAKFANKLIFVDVFTDWCGPCKTMDAEVFPLAEVGDIYNTYFINYKIDAEKGAGPEFKRKYGVQSYPNYLFINGDGVLIYRITGSMQASEFIQQAKIAIDEFKQPMTILDMEKFYASHKKNKKFVFNYLSRLTRLGMNTTDLIDDYLYMLSRSEKSSPETIQLLVDNGTWLNRKLQLGIAMNTLENNQVVFKELEAKKSVHGETLASIKNNAMAVSLQRAITYKDEASLAKVMLLKKDFSEDMFDNKQTTNLKFRYETQDYEMYKKMNRDFINKYLLNIPMDIFLNYDKVFYEHMKRKIEKENDPKNNNQNYIDSYKHIESIKLCNFLTRSVENLLKIPFTQKECEEAKIWAAKAVQIAATDIEFYKNAAPFYQMIYAKILYRNQEKTEALEMIKKLLDINSGNPKAKAVLNELLIKMQSGQEVTYISADVALS